MVTLTARILPVVQPEVRPVLYTVAPGRTLADLVLDHCDQRLLPGRLAAGPLHAYAETDRVGRASVALHESAHSRVEGCAEAGHILGAEVARGSGCPGA